MKLKQRKRGSLWNFLKNASRRISRAVFNRRVFIIFAALFFIMVLFGGFLAGLAFSGFFGTFDNPSKRALDIIHSFGISGLGSFKSKVDGVLRQNVKIPINYMKAQFSDPEQMHIDISFEEFQKIEYKRSQALEIGQLITGPEDWVNGRVRFRGEETKVDLRLKGDFLDHLQGDKWSYRIKVDEPNKAIAGMNVFSIQDPKTRRGVNEYIHFQMLKDEGIIAPRYTFIEVIVNGDSKGIYALEEHFDTELIESNGGREGVIFKFNEDPSWEETFRKKDFYSSSLALDQFRDSKYLGWFYAADIDTFKNRKIPQSQTLGPQFDKAKSIMEHFRRGQLKTSEAFDVEKLATYFAIEALNGCGHGSRWGNIRWYYNPITSRIEPIGYDGDCWKPSDVVMDKYVIHEGSAVENYHLFFSDPLFMDAYIKAVERVSKSTYLDAFFEAHTPQIESFVKIIHKDNPFFYYSKSRYYGNQRLMRDKFDAVQDVNAYLQTVDSRTITVFVGNLELMPLEITGVRVYEEHGSEVTLTPLFEEKMMLYPRDSTTKIVNYSAYEFETPLNFKLNMSAPMTLQYKIFGTETIKEERIFPWEYLDEEFLENDFIRKKTDITSFELFDVSGDRIRIKRGSWNLNESVIFPKGYTVFAEAGTVIDLTNEAMILSYSPLHFVGTPNNPVTFITSDGTGQGLTVIDADRRSLIRHALFRNMTNPHKDDWTLMGGINFYESDVSLDSLIISQANSEDGLNIIHSNYHIANATFQHCNSDCFDSDFSNGTIEHSRFYYCGNDCVDFGSSNAFLQDVGVYNFGDKGMSAGEYSEVIAVDFAVEGSPVVGSTIGVSSKDSSIIYLNNSKISGTTYGIATYNKKPAYGGGSVVLHDVIVLGTTPRLIEEGSSITEDDSIILGEEQGVFEYLYGG